MAVALGSVVFRVNGCGANCSRLLTLAVTFVLATIILNTPIDGGPGVSLGGVAVPAIGPTASSSFYFLELATAAATLGIAYAIWRSKLGTGLFAIRDDEDVAEVLGVPTFRCKLVAFATVLRAGGRGGRHSGTVHLVRHRRRDLFDHRAAHGRADERARRYAALGAGRPSGRRSSR